MIIDKLKEIFDQHFGEPFLTKGEVEAEIRTYGKKKVLGLKIGRRDIELDNKLNVVSSGTCLVNCSRIK